jgi:hypothetical protein
VGLRLLAISSSEGQSDSLPDAVRRVAFGDITAFVSDSPYTGAAASDEAITAHGDAVEAIFGSRTVLPVPPGVLFRSEEALKSWLELHSVVLADALAYLEERVAARVHIRREGVSERASALGTELAAGAAESMRRLRRQAVTSLPLHREHATSIVLSAAFLVERELWKDFVAAVEKENRELEGISAQVTGPWPPWDFVKMDFGG